MNGQALNEWFRQLFPATLQEVRAEDHSPYSNTVPLRCSSPHPKASSICWPQEEGMPHSEALSEHTALSSTSEDLNILRDGMLDYIQRGLGSLS